MQIEMTVNGTRDRVPASHVGCSLSLSLYLSAAEGKSVSIKQRLSLPRAVDVDWTAHFDRNSGNRRRLLTLEIAAQTRLQEQRTYSRSSRFRAFICCRSSDSQIEGFKSCS